MIALIAVVIAGNGPLFRTSEIDVTPDELLPLGGYTARGDAKMEPGGDRLFARTIVFESGAQRVALVSFESLTVPESLYAAVKSRIPPDVGLVIAATHTHSAPDSQMLNERMTFKVPGIATFARRWLDWYSSKIALGIEQALAAEPRDASRIELVQEEIFANHGRRAGADPIRTATWLAFEGRPLLTVYAAHGTIFDQAHRKTSGDWPGEFSKQLGGLVLAGPIGDASPDLPSPVSVENLANMVDKLRAGFRGRRVMASFAAPLQLDCVDAKISLGKSVPHPEFGPAYGAPSPLDQVLIRKFAPHEASVSLVRIGPLLIVGIPGEPTSEVGRKVHVLARSMGFPHAVVVSHCNGWIGYLLTPEDYDRGGYEATLSFHGRETSLRVIEAVESGLKRLSQPELRVAQTR